jgi:uncharacterized membrane protein
MSVTRIEAFSDGIFAIVGTLLVLEIHVPGITGPNVSAALVGGLSTFSVEFCHFLAGYF